MNQADRFAAGLVVFAIYAIVFAVFGAAACGYTCMVFNALGILSMALSDVGNGR